MHVSRLLLPTLFAMLVPFQSSAAEPMQNNQVKLTVVKFDDRVQFQCNPISLATAMRNDWKTICNDMAAAQAGKLMADGTIAAVKGPVFDVTAPNPPAGPMLWRNFALSKAKH